MKRVFVVGCARSGTTLLQGMLAAHHRVFSLPETFFFAKVFPRRWIKRNLLWPAIKVRARLPQIVREMGREDLLPMTHIGMFQRDYHRPFVRVMDRMASDAGKDVWIEKTPWHIHCIDEIQRKIPDAMFVHIVRDGKDTVASLFDATHRNPATWASLPAISSFKGFTVRECVEFWNREVAISMSWKGHPQHMVVRYEDVVKQPQQVAESICNFLGIEYDTEMIDPSRSFRKIVRDDEAWKARNARPISHGERLYDKVFNEDQRSWIVSHLKPFPLNDKGHSGNEQ
jgi:hypothetical protein